MDFTEKRLSRDDVFRGRIVYMHVDEVLLPDGSRSMREIVEHPGGVTVIPVDDEGNVYCVRQYRYAMEQLLLEMPAGKLEDGEMPLSCAMRELEEEIGFTAHSFEYLGEFYPSPGYCHEKLYAYLATGLKMGEARPDEGEFLEVEKYPLDTLAEMAMNGELKDAKSIIAVLKAKLYLDQKGKDVHV